MISQFRIIIQKELSDNGFRDNLVRMLRFVSYVQLLATCCDESGINFAVKHRNLSDFLIDESSVHPDDKYIFKMKEFSVYTAESSDFLANCRRSRCIVVNLECGPGYGIFVNFNFETPRGYIDTMRFPSSIVNL